MQIYLMNVFYLNIIYRIYIELEDGKIEVKLYEKAYELFI